MACVPFATLVSADIVSLRISDLAPADEVRLNAEGLLIAESGLTDKALPVEKKPDMAPAEAPIMTPGFALAYLPLVTAVFDFAPPGGATIFSPVGILSA